MSDWLAHFTSATLLCPQAICQAHFKAEWSPAIDAGLFGGRKLALPENQLLAETPASQGKADSLRGSFDTAKRMQRLANVDLSCTPPGMRLCRLKGQS